MSINTPDAHRLGRTDPPSKPNRRIRADFARAAPHLAFSRHARALDQAEFQDRLPWRMPLRAAEHRPPGPGERAAISALRRQRHVKKLHGLGSRALDELLIEIGTEFGITAFIEQKIERYAALDPEAVQLVGGDCFPAQPIHEVSR